MKKILLRFTDGSKMQTGVGSAYSTCLDECKYQLDSTPTMLTAELYAILKMLAMCTNP